MSKVLSLRVPDELLASLETEAATRGLKVGQLVVEILQRRGDGSQTAAPPAPRPPVPRHIAGAEIVPASQLPARGKTSLGVAVQIGPTRPAPGAMQIAKRYKRPQAAKS
jgi:hypothetical protein